MEKVGPASPHEPAPGPDAQLPCLPGHRDDALSVRLLPGGVTVSLTIVKCTYIRKSEVRQSEWGEGVPAIDLGLHPDRCVTSGKPLQLCLAILFCSSDTKHVTILVWGTVR